MRVYAIYFLLIAGFLNACAASIDDDDNLNLSEAIDGDKSGAIVPAKEKLTTIKFPEGEVEAFECKPAGANKKVLAINGDDFSFAKGLCTEWHAQAFIRKGYVVVAINRPGFANSKGSSDFSGSKTVESISAALKKFKDIKGIWATGSGAAAAAFASKNNAFLEWIVLGNGIYNFESFSQEVKDKTYRDWLQKSGGLGADASSFNEQRSIAWDPAGLPKTVVLYHAKSNKVVPVKQAQEFRDGLAAEQYVVSLNEVDGIDHEIPGFKHSIILQNMITKAQEKPAPVEE